MEKDSDKGERIVVVVVHILLQLVRYKDRPPSFPGSALVGQVAVGRKTPRVLIAVFFVASSSSSHSSSQPPDGPVHGHEHEGGHDEELGELGEEGVLDRGVLGVGGRQVCAEGRVVGSAPEDAAAASEVHEVERGAEGGPRQEPEHVHGALHPLLLLPPRRKVLRAEEQEGDHVHDPHEAQERVHGHGAVVALEHDFWLKRVSNYKLFHYTFFIAQVESQIMSPKKRFKNLILKINDHAKLKLVKISICEIVVVREEKKRKHPLCKTEI